MNKKAALNLGISTVVVMVIAMVVIGAGVSFIRTFFTAGTDSLIGAFDGVGDLGIQPDRSNPFVLSTENINGRPGEVIIVQAGIYNPTTTDWGSIDFRQTASCANDESLNVSGVAQGIPAGEFRGFTLGLELPSGSGETICALRLTRNTVAENIPTSKQLTVSWGN